MAGLFGAPPPTSQGTDQDLVNDRVLSNPPEDSISSMSFSSQADFIAVGSWDKKVRIYEVLQTGDSQGRALYEHQAPVLSVQWSGDGTKVASGGCDNAVRLFDVQSGQSTQIGSHDAAVKAVRWVEVGAGSGTGQQVVASASWDKTLRYWDLRSPQPASTVQLPERAYSMDSQKKLLVVATAERHVCIIDLSNPGTIFKSSSSPLKWQTRAVSCFPSGNGFALGSIEGRCGIQYIDPEEQSKLSFSFKCHRVQNTTPRPESIIYSVNDIAFHPVFGTFVTAGSDGTFQIWDKDAKQRLKSFPQVGGTIPCTTFNRNGSILAYAVSYDWSKGYQFNTQNYPNAVRFHPCRDDETKQRPKKK